MERCLDCAGVLKNHELVCPMCGANAGSGNCRSVDFRKAEFFSKVGRIMLCISIVALIASPFIPNGPTLVVILCLSSCALMCNNAP